MKLTQSSLLFIILCSLNSLGQNMSDGFKYLETGKYTQAQHFFETILVAHPTNKTARLCYGRATGLLGRTGEAVNLFTKLLADYPLDFEVKLNYAEALLWNSNYRKAKIYYKKLLKENNESFPALLGYANTLSNLKEFEVALLYADKALVIIPKNNNALISKKYIRLGLANKKIQTKEYRISENLLKQNLKTFRNDKETLINLANLYLISDQIDKARNTYIYWKTFKK
jgi:tetratricopeptide (TPR) repeat protein